jgi:hypothetical protein
MKLSTPLLSLALLGLLAACRPATPAIDTNIAGEAAGLFRGIYVAANGEVFLDYDLELHRVADDRVSAEPAGNNQQEGGRFMGFEMQLMRSGAVIHHQLGHEAEGTFTLDAAVTPDQLRFDLPNGESFDGVRVKNYHE